MVEELQVLSGECTVPGDRTVSQWTPAVESLCREVQTMGRAFTYRTLGFCLWSLNLSVSSLIKLAVFRSY